MSNNLALSGTFFVLFMVLCGAGYVFGVYVLYRIGRKFGVGSFADYCIPVYNYVLLCRCAGISPGLLLWLVVPLADLGFIVYFWGTLAKKLGHEFWLFGLGIFVFGIPALILAFDESKPAGGGTTVTLAKPSIYCLSGEFSGNRLPVELTGMIMGRSAESSNLVLSSIEISARHARVWADPEGRVWIEDLKSSNGTYYCQPREGEMPEWIEVTEPVALAVGAHFCLGDSTVEFEVC
jgi:FHA domain/Family of unknown function (DUF5684)